MIFTQTLYFAVVKGLAMDASVKERLHLSADALYRLVRLGFHKIPDHRCGPVGVSLGDALLAAFALFALKAPSLLAFDQRRQTDEFNLKSLFGMKQIPCDTQMRTILDEVDPTHLRSSFTDVFRQLQRGKALEPFAFFQGRYLLALDGTFYFSSEKIHCASCLEKKSRNGKIAYSHQMLGAVLVHPDLREVIPLCPEPIIKQDGQTKNDCERNATRRFLAHFRREHPYLPVIVLEDALSANAPHIADLDEHKLPFIIAIKPGSHASLFAQMQTAFEQGQAQVLTLEDSKGTLWHYRWLDNAFLNESHPDVLVTMLELWQLQANGTQRQFTWITRLPVNEATAPLLACGGRTRWHIENETFNTLKNQGYQFDHNFGHGHNNLSVVFALMMMLAFLIDQTIQRCDRLFQALWETLGSKRNLWEHVRGAFHYLQLTSMHRLYQLILSNYKATPPSTNSS
jgi:hypothetical protein